MRTDGPTIPADLVDSALANLVRQFARPLDCLRELVQNSIDAGSPRVEVELAYSARDAHFGTLAIAVRDFGEGMDEHVIDHELTRMFASSKAGDLTRIGRFGIGFTSVFAIAPEAVHVCTGRHGDGWELVFHPDRSFDKIRLEAPVNGTCVTLYKRIPTVERERWRRDIEDALSFWCEHCSIAVVLRDEALSAPAVQPPATAVPDDAFAAFAQPTVPVGRNITRPLDLPGAEWVVHHQEEGIDVLVGIGPTPTYRWYNGGLTLLSTTDPTCLGDHAKRLAHLTFKVQHRGLEHTLTRDNVIQDQEWKRAIDLLDRASHALEQQLLQAHAAALESGTSLEPSLDALARIASHKGTVPGITKRAARYLPGSGQTAVVIHAPQLEGPPMPLLTTPAPECAPRPSPLTRALRRAGHAVVRDLRSVRILAAVAGRPLPDPPERRWVVAHAVASGDAALTRAIEDLLRAAGVASLSVNWCSIEATGAPVVILRPPTDTPMRRAQLLVQSNQRLLGIRACWLNTAHANVRLAADVAQLAPDVGAFAVLQAAFAQWGGLADPRFSRIQAAVSP